MGIGCLFIPGWMWSNRLDFFKLGSNRLIFQGWTVNGLGKTIVGLTKCSRIDTLFSDLLIYRTIDRKIRLTESYEDPINYHDYSP